MLSGIVASAADITIVVDPSGLIRSAMVGLQSRSFEQVASWPGKNLSEVVDPDSFPKFEKRSSQILDQVEGGVTDAFNWVELVHLSVSEDNFPVRYSLHWLEDQQALLMLGRDQRPVVEMQQQIINAQIALERDYEAQRELDTRYRLLMDFTSDSIAIVAMGSGRIVDLNHHAATLFGKARADLVGSDFSRLFAPIEGEPLLNRIAATLPRSGAEPLNAITQRDRLEIKVHSRVFRASGERLALCRMTGGEPGSGGAGPLTEDLDQLFYKGVDAIVFTDKDGIIIAASDAFLNITDSVGLEAVRGRSMADFLSRGAIDLKVLLDNARRAGHLRSYATKLVTDFDAQVSVEMSASWLGDRLEPRLALIIRDTSSTLSMRSDLSLAEENVRGVMELVGSTALKDIVAETTNVVERICIETAIELTRNNRVAAAEMLGLSRQSLYVKLRKHGLLSREDE
ncbi:transcriptional regulator PpsR [Pararhodobacter sp. SW119]|uniref:transcriptional regulator PpsR n=1 Tax=Pararhodobacter sp. SW119 TaxID=2780075 RepID=UPI001FD7397F|nr:transcriptional regulator PpsR [Pararhodobacter sp. SW119]